jgi:prepilin-type N-terminal cleavage/methylation domain-containing protein
MGMELAVRQRMSSKRIEYRSSRCSRGFSLIEIVVAVAIIAMLSGAVAIAVIVQKRWADENLARTNAETIRLGVSTWWATHDTGTCPTVQQLASDGAIKRGKTEDVWGQPYAILCDVDDATVVSRGRDKLAGTEDDIRVPPS